MVCLAVPCASAGRPCVKTDTVVDNLIWSVDQAVKDWLARLVDKSGR